MSKGRRPGQLMQADQRRVAFAAEYMLSLNGPQAAIRAGFSAKTAAQAASRLLRDAKVQAEIAKIRAQNEQKAELTREKWLSRLVDLSWANLSDIMDIQPDGSALVNLNKATPEQRQAIEKYSGEVVMVGDPNTGYPVLKMRVEMVDRLKALDMIGKAQGYYAPIKVAQTDTQGNDVDPTLELRARLAAVVQRLPRGGAVEPGPADSAVGA